MGRQMQKKSVIIIGAGIAGLSAGCYLQMNGYNTEIFEAHNVPGGLCTAWKRKGYVVEGCIHGLLGSRASHPYYNLWNEVVDMAETEFIDQEVKETYYFPDGSKFIKYADLDKLAHNMKKIAPEDSKIIDEFIRDTRKFQSVEMPVAKARELYNIIDYLKMIKSLPLLRVMKKWIKVTAGEFAEKFQNPFLRSVVQYFSSPVLFEMFVLAEMDLKRCGYPVGGSLEFARKITDKYTAGGGKINYNNRVSKIMVENDRVTGIKLEDGQVHKADIVISAADGKTTIYDFLDGKYLDKTIEREYKQGNLNPSKVQIALGIDRYMEDYPRTIKLLFDKPWESIDGSKYDSIDVLVYSGKANLAPPGKTLIVVQIDTEKFDYWKELRNRDKKEYRRVKGEIARQLIKILEERLDSIKNYVVMVDIATPVTYKRYTGNWKGSIQGWANENIFKSNPFKKELPGLENFYICGQWVVPGGGVPNVFKSGRDLAQIICKKDNKIFLSKN